MIARKGKIACLPKEVREELNERLNDGELAPQILPWINSLPVVRERLSGRARSEDGEVPEITDGNLSEWRKGGYAEWCQDGKVRSLAKLCDRMADATGQPVESLVRKVYAGKMLEALESIAAEEDLTDEEGNDAGRGISRTFLMAGGTIAQISSASQREVEHKVKARQTDIKLAIEKLKVARAFVKFYADAKAVELAELSKADDRNLPLLADYLLGIPDVDRLANQ